MGGLLCPCSEPVGSRPVSLSVAAASQLGQRAVSTCASTPVVPVPPGPSLPGQDQRTNRAGDPARPTAGRGGTETGRVHTCEVAFVFSLSYLLGYCTEWAGDD